MIEMSRERQALERMALKKNGVCALVLAKSN
jgi:hypothetical protein